MSLTKPPVLSFFNLNDPTCLSTDASRLGIGFIHQQQSNNKWTIIQAGSRFLTDTESRYATIELEMLAVAWAIQKCKLFLTDLQHFCRSTDHNPLVPILNSHCLDEIENPRLQQLKSHLMAYNFTAKWIKVSVNDAPDALSHNPVSDPHNDDALAEFDPHNEPALSITELRAITTGIQDNLKLQDVRDHAEMI